MVIQLYCCVVATPKQLVRLLYFLCAVEWVPRVISIHNRIQLVTLHAGITCQFH